MKRTLAEAETKIKAELFKAGPYSHNIIGLVLSEVAKEYSTAEANKLIDKCGLKKHGWSKVEES